MARPDEIHGDYVQRMQLRRRQVMKAFALGGSAGVATFLLNSCANTPAPTPTTAAAPTAAPAATTAPAPTTAAASPTVAAQPTAAATTAAATPTAAAAAATATTAPAATPAAAGTALPTTLSDAFRMNLGSENDTNDPGRASFVNEIEVVMRVFSNSYTFDAKANLVNDQADSAPQLSADGKTITVKLKSGLVWSDGKPLTAKDWVYGTLRQLSPVVAGDYAFTLYPLVGAEEYNGADPSKTDAAGLKKLRDAVGISAPDATTIVYKLKEATPWFLQVLATWNGLPVRQDIIKAGGKPEDNQDWITPANYIGNGPYKMTVHDPNVQYVFESNDKYVRGAPPLKKVQMLMIPDTTVALAAYKAGNLDRAAVGALTVDAVTKDATLSKEYQKVAGNCTFYLGFNTTLKPFDDMKVRQAFSYAFDRKTFVDQVLKGLGLPATQFLPPDFPGLLQGDHAPGIRRGQGEAAALRRRVRERPGAPAGQVHLLQQRHQQAHRRRHPGNGQAVRERRHPAGPGGVEGVHRSRQEAGDDASDVLPRLVPGLPGSAGLVQHGLPGRRDGQPHRLEERRLRQADQGSRRHGRQGQARSALPAGRHDPEHRDPGRVHSQQRPRLRPEARDLRVLS